MVYGVGLERVTCFDQHVDGPYALRSHPADKLCCEPSGQAFQWSPEGGLGATSFLGLSPLTMKRSDCRHCYERCPVVWRGNDTPAGRGPVSEAGTPGDQQREKLLLPPEIGEDVQCSCWTVAFAALNLAT